MGTFLSPENCRNALLSRLNNKDTDNLIQEAHRSMARGQRDLPPTPLPRTALGSA